MWPAGALIQQIAMEDQQLQTDRSTVVTKEVTIVAYADADNVSEKEWANVVTGEPTNETRIETDEKVKMTINTGSDFHSPEVTVNDYELGDDQTLQEFAKKMNRKQDIEAEYIHNESEAPKTSLRSAARQLRDDVMNQLPDSLQGGISKADHMAKWADSDRHDWKVRMRSPEIKSMRVLSKEQKREDDNLYETLTERPCFSMMVKMEGPSDEWMETWTEELIPTITKILSRYNGVGKVRFMSCTKSREEEGECYNI